MISGPELEDGETCYYKDDTSIDPDDDKVQSILGHLQKDFEGGVSAENLGAKFGGYGSFLPMHQRSPIWSQSKSPQRVQNSHLPRSPKSLQRVQNPHLPILPNYISTEGPASSSVTVPDVPNQRNGQHSSPCMSASKTSQSSFEDDSTRQKATLSPDKVGEALPRKDELPSSNSGNPPDQRTLKVRIKVGPDRVAQYNAEIYSLGLTSPSSSEGNSQDENDELLFESQEIPNESPAHIDELLFESQEIPNESPAHILQIMTSSPVTGGLLLSPLCEELISLVAETENSVESLHGAASKSSTFSHRLLNNNVSGGKNKKMIEKSKNFEKSQDEFVMNLNNSKQQILNGSDKQEHSLQSPHEFYGKELSNTFRESEKDIQVKNRRGSKDRVKGRAFSGDVGKDTSLEHTSDQSCGKSEPPESRFNFMGKVARHQARISKKDVSVNHGQCSRSKGSENLASIKTCSDNFEGEVVKGSMDNLSLKVGQNAVSSKHNGLGTLCARNRLSFEGKNKSKESQTSGKLALKADSLRDGGCTMPQNKDSRKKNVRRLHRNQKDVVYADFENVDNPKHSLERPSGDKPKDFTPGAAKAKFASSDKLKERSGNEKNIDEVAPYTHIADPPVAAAHTRDGIFSGLEQTAVAPVLIEEEWVGCDRCEKWRLLPYGTKSEQLPDKWVCSMLDWLPGMNHCDISEDETTRAVQALPLAAVPENQHNFQICTDGTMAGVISANAHDFRQGHQNCASVPVKKRKLKEKQNTVNASNPVLSKGKKPLQQLAMKSESSKEVKQSPAGIVATNKSDMQHSNKSADVAKSNKQKSKDMVGDESNLRKKIKRNSSQQVEGKVKKIKSKDRPTVDKFQTSAGNMECSLTSGLPNKIAKKGGMKKSAQKDPISGGLGNLETYVKKRKDQMHDLADNEPLGLKPCNGGEISKKRIKLKDDADIQHRMVAWQENGSNLPDQNFTVEEDSRDDYSLKDKKTLVSQIEEEFKINQGGDISKRKNADHRVQLSGSKEYLINGDTEKDEKVKKQRVKLRLTIEDIDKLRKDLGCEQLSTAATSSSSKVSDSRKNRISYMEVKGSPEESVSSSPVKMPCPNEVSPLMETVGKVDSRFNNDKGGLKKFRDMNESFELSIDRKGTSGLTKDNGSEILDSRIKLKEETDVDENYNAPKHELSSNKRHRGIKSVKNGTSVGKKDLEKSSESRRENEAAEREHDKSGKKSNYSCGTGVGQQNLNEDFPKSSTGQISTEMESCNGKVCKGDKRGALCPSKHASGSLGYMKDSLDASLVGDTSKALKDTAVVCLQNGTGNFINNGVERSLALDASLGNKNDRSVTAFTALKKAEDILKKAEELRIHADLIKNSGFSSESNYGYFKAALKFLHGALLLEACNGESSKHLEMSPMQMYGTAAKLCKTCACEYEKCHEMAAAALAYKCMEVAYLKIVYCKSSTTRRVCHDLQSSLQMVPQGESPSSSVSDVDNLNNFATVDRATFAKGSGSHAGNQVILPHNRPNFVRLLDFTKDVNSAMEAAKKSQDTFSAAHVELEESQNKEAITAVKRVIELSFQNIDDLVRLVWLAFNAINHQGPSGGRD